MNDSSLGDRLEALGREVGQREAAHVEALEAARRKAESLRETVAAALARFHAGAHAAGAVHLHIDLGDLRADEKHVRAVEFDLARGRSRAIITVKSRGDVTLVGPFHRGKTEGPCRTFPMDADGEIQVALADFIGRFIEEATTP